MPLAANIAAVCADSCASSVTTRLIGVAEYQLVRALPEPLDTNLPSIEEIDEAFGSVNAEESFDARLGAWGARHPDPPAM